MENTSHLKLITMGLLQTCSYVTEQMQTKVTIDINKFMEAFSIDVDTSHFHPPSWTLSNPNSGSDLNMPQPPIRPNSSSISSSSSTILDMDFYRTSRQAEAIRWINLQEKRSSIMARLQPTTSDDYQHLRDSVTSDKGPLRRTFRKQPGKKEIFHHVRTLMYIMSLLQPPNEQLMINMHQTTSILISQRHYLTSLVDVSYFF